MFHDHTIVQRLQAERTRQLARRTRRPPTAEEREERPDRRALPLPRLRARTP